MGMQRDKPPVGTERGMEEEVEERSEFRIQACSIECLQSRLQAYTDCKIALPNVPKTKPASNPTETYQYRQEEIKIADSNLV